MLRKISLMIASCGALFAVALLPGGCSKSNTGTGSSGSTLMQPASVSFYEGGNAAYPTLWTYTYDKDNLLVKYGAENSWIKEVGVHGHVLYTYSGYNAFATGYTYSVAGRLDTSVNIYTEAPSQLSVSLKVTDVTTNVSTYSSQGTFLVYINASQQLLGMSHQVTGGISYSYRYDDEGNLATVDYYKSAGSAYSRLTVDAVDDKHSPFSAVKAYNLIAWPVAYAADYALAYCKNNPLSITVKSGSTVSEKSSFTYEYNEQGYPTTVTVTTVYNPNDSSPSTVTKTYHYTYRSL